MKNDRIHISIGFGDAILPVVKCDDGHDRVPLKPIVEQVGVQWAGQRRKLTSDDYLVERLGAKTETSRCLEKPELCIRLDRVEAFLNQINPKMVVSKGNSEAAEWLKSKHDEWDNALHSYETQGIAVKDSKGSSVINVLAKIDGIKNPELRKIAIENANQEFGLNIRVATQMTLGE